MGKHFKNYAFFSKLECTKPKTCKINIMNVKAKTPEVEHVQ